MSQIDQLLERRRSPGRLIDRKRFTLSRDKAVEKLREFTLRNPRQYILELVQGAVFSGASYIAIDVDPEHAQVAWVGAPPLSEGQLSRLFDFLFADRGGRAQRHLVQLAIALNALLQRKPKVLRIESGDGRRTVRMDLDHKGRGQVGTAAQPISGTYVLAEFGSNWFKRFQGDSYTEEISLVEENCRFTPVPILLNGRAPFGYKASHSARLFGVDDVEPFSEAEGARWGVLGTPSVGSRSGVHIVRGGVRVTTLELPQLGMVPRSASRPEPAPLAGVIADDDLRETADRSDIVRDHRFQRMLHAVQPVATRLLRRQRPGYRPPALPPLAEGPQDEPLPEPIPQLGPRPALRLEELRRRPPDAPLFHVSPDDAQRLQSAADPLRFPYPVLILRGGQLPSLDRALPDMPAHRLGTPSDVDFVRRAIQRRRRQVEVTVPCPRQPQVPLTLSLTLPGRGLDPGPTRGLPVLLTQGDTTVQIMLLQLDLPGVWARVERGDEAPSASTLRQAIADATWRLILRGMTEGIPTKQLRPLLIRVLSTHATPRLVHTDQRRLDLSLPADWEHSARLRQLPLADTRQGPLTVQRLVELQGTTQVLDLSDADDLRALAPLELLLGVGHLRHPHVNRPIAAVARLPAGWRWWTGRAWDDGDIRQILWVGLTHQPQVAGYPNQGAPVSMVGLSAHRTPGEGELDAGLTMLYQNLLRIAMIGDWSQLTPPGLSTARVEAAGRLALLQLATHLERIDKDPLFAQGSGRGRTPLATLAQTPGFCVVAAGGPQVPGETTLHLTLDELQACDPSQALRQCFDDPAQVWRSMFEPDASGWLLRQRVHMPGLHGWLGLRCPYDESTGVFVQTSKGLVALPHLDRALPCHGLLRADPGPPHPQRHELLSLARRELYQQLMVTLTTAQEGSEEHRAATLYATIYTVQAWREAGGKLRASAGEMADIISVPDESGRAWGTLRRWLQAPAPRPALPVRLRPLAQPRRDTGDTFDTLQRRLIAACPAPIKVNIDTSPGGGALIVLDPQLTDAAYRDFYFTAHLGHPGAQALQSGAPRMVELTLLEMARQVAISFAEPTQALLDMQRSLVGQRQL